MYCRKLCQHAGRRQKPSSHGSSSLGGIPDGLSESRQGFGRGSLAGLSGGGKGSGHDRVRQRTEHQGGVRGRKTGRYIVAQRVCSAMGLWPRGRNWNRRRNGLQNRGGHRRNQREIGRGGRGISYC